MRLNEKGKIPTILTTESIFQVAFECFQNDIHHECTASVLNVSQ